MSKKLHIGNLPPSITDQQLSDKFSRFGVVELAVVVRDDLSGENCGYGLVEMDEPASAAAAIKWLNFSSYGGQIMAVSYFDSSKAAH